jgi:hypothetical protein
LSWIKNIPAASYTKEVKRYQPKIDPSLKRKYNGRGRHKSASTLHNTMRVSPEFLEMVKVERKPYERLEDTALRMLKERTDKISQLMRILDGGQAGKQP